MNEATAYMVWITPHLMYENTSVIMCSSYHHYIYENCVKSLFSSSVYFLWFLFTLYHWLYDDFIDTYLPVRYVWLSRHSPVI